MIYNKSKNIISQIKVGKIIPVVPSGDNEHKILDICYLLPWCDIIYIQFFLDRGGRRQLLLAQPKKCCATSSQVELQNHFATTINFIIKSNRTMSLFHLTTCSCTPKIMNTRQKLVEILFALYILPSWHVPLAGLKCFKRKMLGGQGHIFCGHVAWPWFPILMKYSLNSRTGNRQTSTFNQKVDID